jgi:hypothetical protein
MLQSESITEFGQLLACVLGIVVTVVKMNLQFAVSAPAMVRKPFNQGTVILLCRIEVRMHERTSVVITPGVDNPGILAAPSLESALLLGERGARLPVVGNNRRLKVIRQGDYQVNAVPRHTANHTLPRVGW